LYLTSSFVFEDAEDMRASFAEEKDRNIYSYSNPNTNEFVEKYVKWKATAGFAFASGMAAYIQRWLRY
jgi:O-succinylhomoserine sulfhydrylase